MTYKYRVYDMVIISDYELLQLVKYEPDGKEYPTITISAGMMPDDIRMEPTLKWNIGQTRSWLNNDTTWLLIENGNKIVYELKDSSNPSYLNAYIIGFGFAMLAQQRGILAIHCSAVADKDGAILIAGESGAGKSTLTSAFLQRGYRLMADDMAYVEPSQSSKPSIASPAFPYQKLCRNVVLEKGYPMDKLIYINEQKDKFLVPYEGEFRLEPVSVKGLIMLGRSNTEEVVSQEIRGIESFQIIANNLFLRHLLGKQKYAPEIGKLCLQMAGSVHTAYIGRPTEKNTTDEVIRCAFEIAEQW